jgi:hypothetical protein
MGTEPLMADREDTPVPSVQTTGCDSAVDGIFRVPQPVQLLAGDDSVLSSRKRREIVMRFHGAPRAERERVLPPEPLEFAENRA